MGSESILGTLAWGGGGVDWIRMGYVKGQWYDVVFAVINLRVLAPRS
jgi:hypothetical protein